MATYTDNYNLKMPSGQDAPDVEDFNGNAEIIDKALGAHANNFADKYDPDSTYTQGKLCIQNDALWKAKQNIDAPEPWTESHWESTTLAAELSALNSRLGSWSRVTSMSVGSNETYDVELPENKALLLAVENTYGVGCLYFVQTALSSENRDAATYSLGGNPNYFKIESISGQAAKVKVTPGEASGTLKIYSF